VFLCKIEKRARRGGSRRRKNLKGGLRSLEVPSLEIMNFLRGKRG